MSSIDKESRIPYYIQIKKVLKDRIMENFYKCNTLLPSENKLSEEFDVTRVTIRNAIKELKKEGLISVQKGKGTFVSKPKIEQSLLKFYSFGREFRDSKHNISSKSISKKEIKANSYIAEKLEIEVNEAVYEIVRLRIFNNCPMILETFYVPVKLMPNLINYDLERGFVYDLIEENYDLKIVKAKEYISPKIADDEESNYLEINSNSPVFYTERITLTIEDKPIELRQSVIRGDKYAFYTELY